MSWTPDDESERLLEVWTERLVKNGGRVIAARRKLIGPLGEAVSRYHRRIAGDSVLEVGYRSSVKSPGSGDRISGESPAGEKGARELLSSALERVSVDERRRGFTLVGPHRDDLEVALDGRPIRTFGSQGQHRTAAIALKLGQAEVLDQDGRGVVVLLDDIMSELDDERGRSLMELVGGLGQALMTSTRPAPGDSERMPERTFLVEAGTVVRRD
jgi:DNA replication and repair protein RecF